MLQDCETQSFLMPFLYSSAINLTTVPVQGLNTASNKSISPQELFFCPPHTTAASYVQITPLS